MCFDFCNRFSIYHIQTWQSAAHPKQKIYTTYVFDETLNLSFSIICHSIEKDKLWLWPNVGNLGEVSGTPTLWQTDPHCLSQRRAVFCESLKHKTTNDCLQGFTYMVNLKEVNMVVYICALHNPSMLEFLIGNCHPTSFLNRSYIFIL